jgi:SAM-dependent methyltransferase
VLRRRAESFGAVADAYERARPGYPREAVAWIAADALEILDLGAGTGKLTRGLVALGRAVVAVEPSPEMAAKLRRAVPEARVVRGSAETIPLPDESVDAVVAGQAYHWFDPPRALPEIARVLRPGGTLGLVWNSRDDAVPWVARLSELLRQPEWGEGPEQSIDASALFRPVERSEFRSEQRLDRDGLLELVRSASGVAILGDDARRGVLDAVGRLFDDAAGGGELVLPYVTRCFRAVRR